MALSKSKRFEIFMRDAFTCQYCGKRPPEVVLEVDHIEARANGGTDEDINLITSCFGCNRGKGKKALGTARPRPDADLEFLKMQQEIVEAKRYLKAKKQRDVIEQQVIQELCTVWNENLTPDEQPNDPQWRTWMSRYSADEIEKAIVAASRQYKKKKNYWHFDSILAYVSGILKHQREDE